MLPPNFEEAVSQIRWNTSYDGADNQPARLEQMWFVRKNCQEYIVWRPVLTVADLQGTWLQPRFG